MPQSRSPRSRDELDEHDVDTGRQIAAVSRAEAVPYMTRGRMR